MEEPNKLDWANSLDQIQIPSSNSGIIFQDCLPRDCCTNFPDIVSPRNFTIKRDQFSFHQGITIDQQQAGNNNWNCHNSSKPIDLNFGGTTDLNLKEWYEEFDKKRQQGQKIVNKGLAPMHGQDHIIAERKRREKLNQRFIELSSVIPSLKKIDKASILIDAVEYIKELEKKVKNLETQNPKPIESAVLVKNTCISSEGGDLGCSSSTAPKPLLEIEARLSGNKILISIHCESFKGLLVKVLSELEELNVTVTHTNLMHFARSTSFITLNAQMEEGSNITADNVVRQLNSALHQLKSRND